MHFFSPPCMMVEMLEEWKNGSGTPVHMTGDKQNLKRKLYNCNASIYFNRKCLSKRLTPSYAKIKIPNSSPAHTHTHTTESNQKLRIKDEIKFLHSKKQKLNS